jgi:hypothetical protein
MHRERSRDEARPSQRRDPRTIRRTSATRPGWLEHQSSRDEHRDSLRISLGSYRSAPRRQLTSAQRPQKSRRDRGRPAASPCHDYRFAVGVHGLLSSPRGDLDHDYQPPGTPPQTATARTNEGSDRFRCLGTSHGADDGIRTRDPHLGKVVDLVRRLDLTPRSRLCSAVPSGQPAESAPLRWPTLNARWRRRRRAVLHRSSRW